MAYPVVTHEHVLKVLSYDRLTGEFTWLAHAEAHPKFLETYVGKIAGSPDKDGYTSITIDGRRYRANRLAWFYVYGVWPAKIVDHRDRDRKNDAIENLRLATPKGNAMNRGVMSNNTSGFKGVSLGRRGKWVANICKNRRPIYIGQFDTPQEASVAYEAKAKELFGEFYAAAA